MIYEFVLLFCYIRSNIIIVTLVVAVDLSDPVPLWLNTLSLIMLAPKGGPGTTCVVPCIFLGYSCFSLAITFHHQIPIHALAFMPSGPCLLDRGGLAWKHQHWHQQQTASLNQAIL
jgi:hypothetical protein